MSWKPEVFVDRQWSSNALRFATKEESDAYALDLLMRWTMPSDCRSVECDEPVTHVWDMERGLRSLSDPEEAFRFPARRVQL